MFFPSKVIVVDILNDEPGLLGEPLIELIKDATSLK